MRREFYGGPLDGEVRDVPPEWETYFVPLMRNRSAVATVAQVDPPHIHKYSLCGSGHFHYDGDGS